MRKNIAIILAIIIIVGLFCGCEGYYDPNLEKPIANTPVETTVTAQPETQPAPTYPISTESTAHGDESVTYKIGEEVWFVAYDMEYTNDTWVYPGSVVVTFDSYVVVSRFSLCAADQGHVEAMTAELLDHADSINEYCCVHLVSIDDCYRTSTEAWTAAGKEPLE
jgi:hypothetical protein